MGPILLSIIIPVYNSEKTLTRLLDSIIDQKVSSFEVIAVDDGSTDNSIKILKEYKKKIRKLIIIPQKNSGQAKARNNALKYADGNWILFLDSDDEMAPNALPNMLLKTKKHKLVVGGIIKIFKGHMEREIHAVFETAKSDQELITSYLLNNREMDVGLWNKLFSKEVIKNNSIRFQDTNYFEDSFFVFQYLLSISHYDIDYVHQVVYKIFKREGSTTRRLDKKLSEKTKAYTNNVEKELDFFEISEKDKNELISGLRVRLEIFETHQHFKFDEDLDLKLVSQRLKNTRINFRTLIKLRKKYFFAYFGLCWVPHLYRFIYLRRKN